MSAPGDRICWATDSVPGQIARIDALDRPYFEEYPDGFLRPVLEGEVELVGIPEMLGVFCVPDVDGSMLRIPVESWSHIVEMCEGVGHELPGTPAQVAECLGVSLVDLGIVRVAE